MTVLVVRFTREHFYARANEWFMAAMTLGLAVAMMLQPDLFSSNPVFIVLGSWAPQDGWEAGLLGVALMRFGALVINGAWRRTPHLRGLSAFLTMFLWWLLSVSAFQSETSNLGVAIYPLFLFADGFNVFRAMGDAGAADKAAADGA